jgi:protein involved in sex pheromone biosynthesis
MSETIYTEDEIDDMVKDIKSQYHDLAEKIEFFSYRIERIEQLLGKVIHDEFIKSVEEEW